MGYHPAGHLALDSVVTNGIGGAHRFLDVTAFEIFFRMVRPDTRIEIGLKFEADRVFVVIRPATHRTDFIRDTQEFLDMMADFMRDDIRLRKVRSEEHTSELQ